MTTKKFSLRTILTVTTGRLLTKREKDGGNGIGDLYEVLGWMTNDSPFTHQLPRFADECKPWLVRWFPELASAEAGIDKLDGWLKKCKPGCEEEGVKMWLAEMKMFFPTLKDEYDVPRIPQDDHTEIDPVQELADRIGADKIISVELDE